MPKLRLASGLLALTLASPALADSIDGKWCSEDGRRITIEGSLGLWGTAGLKISGDYLRYTYLFAMPSGEPEAGQKVEMRFRRMDQTIAVKIGEGEAKIWRKCPPDISRSIFKRSGHRFA
ncbi:MAG: hypothetical protein MUF11_06980 [Beijerinckiaceae bacterium]|nr:hypothetical protein [Beijerinckiaceae bacterium]